MNEERIIANGGGYDDAGWRTLRIERVITRLNVVCTTLGIDETVFVESLRDHKGSLVIEWRTKNRNVLILEIIKQIWSYFENEYTYGELDKYGTEWRST